MVLDDIVHIGSSNFDIRSLYLNLEMMLRVDDPEFAQLLRNYFEQELAQSQPITAELHRKRSSWWTRLVQAISFFLVTSADYTITRRLNLGGSRRRSRHAQNRVAGGTLTHSKPRSIRSKCGAMKSRTLGLN